MATSGSIREIYNKSLFGAHVYVELSWRQTSISIEDNTSTIEWEFKEISGQSLANGLKEDYEIWFQGKYYNGTDRMGIAADSSRVIARGTEVVKHNENGKFTINYTFSITRKNVNFSILSAAGYAELDPIVRQATLLTAPNFNDEENPTITYSNPAGESITELMACISFTGAMDDVVYRAISKTGTSYTFELTDEERATLRRGMSASSGTVRFYVKSVVGGITYWSYLTKTLTLVNYEPTLSPTVVDTNARTLELTGNPNKLIKYHSNASVTFGAVAHKEAEIISRQVICGSQTKEIEDREQDTVVIEGVDSNTFYLQTIDSRNIYRRDAVVFSEDNGYFIPYIKLTNNLKTGLLSANGTLEITISGKYFNGSFGAQNNTMELEYSVRDSDGNYVTNPNGSGWHVLGDITPTVDEENNYTYTFTISGLNYNKTYTVAVNVIDELTPAQTATKVVAAVPIFDWSKTDFHHHTNVYLDRGKNIRTIQSDGSDAQVMGVNTNNSLTIGWGGYANENGDTGIYGKNLRLFTKEKLYINDREYGANKVLWSNSIGYYMNENQTITLSEAISNQPNGIVLVFSAFEPATGYPLDVSWNTHFVPKHMVNINKGGGQSFFLMSNAGFGGLGAKYLYINNTTITGHSGNTTVASNSGVTFGNVNFVLRYVIGV